MPYSDLPEEMSVFTTQQTLLNNIITKNKAVIAGTGYAGTAPDYSDLTVDNTDATNLAFTSEKIYYPGINVGYKEVHDTVSSLNRFSQTIGYTRGDYYTLEDKELTTLGNFLTYTEQIINRLIQVPL